MKRFFATLMAVAVVVGALLPVCAKERVNPKYYREMLEPIDQEVALLEDNSSSMQNTFAYEKETIDYHLSETNFSKKFTTSGNLWAELNTVQEDYDCIVVSTDLWNTGEEKLEPAVDKKIALLVPYRSTNREGTKHVEEVVWEEIMPYWTDSTIIVIYLDTYMEVYDGEVFMDMN